MNLTWHWRAEGATFTKVRTLVLDPDTGELTRLFHPRRDEWQEHFTSQVSGQIESLTPVGRTTARVLNMNDERRVQLRKAILAMEAGSSPSESENE